MSRIEHDSLLQSLLRQWAEIKTLQQYLHSTDDEQLLRATFNELEPRLNRKRIFTEGAENLEV